ncbi:MAG: HAD-IIIA family hydrolase [Bdellovibrionaceae bacterium]|nr:HAD-IIIA family hydrolase [Pseudobdellovibrionaceae bacterium]MDW8190009.1 HAD-IIIA family hydrolase [Pseudobdellovibrionaceae bacterium]
MNHSPIVTTHNPTHTPSKALFLDRDGVIVYDAGYTRDPDLVCLIPGIVGLIKKAKQLGYQIFIVTNQSGIGRKRIHLDDYQAVTQRMLDLLQQQGSLFIDGICFAPYFEGSPDPVLPENQIWEVTNSYQIPHVGCWDPLWRKPQLGMISYLVKRYHLDSQQSMIVGDRWTDQLLAVHYPLKKGLWFCEHIDSFTESVNFLATQPEAVQNKIVISNHLTHFIDYL